MTQNLFWYQYNKRRTKCCHILKAHKFAPMIYNYMDISSSLMLNFFASYACYSRMQKHWKHIKIQSNVIEWAKAAFT